MSYTVRHLVGLTLALGLFAVPRPALAGWLETQIRSYSATVDVESDGKAVVASELVLSVRGGPLKRFEVQGVDPDAQPLPDATVTPTVTGAASLPLLVERRDDGTLLLEVDHEKGLRSGRYNFAFRYGTNLAERGMIQRRPSYAELRWVSPRFEQGIDSMRVLLRLPPAPTPPALPSYDANDPEAPFGAFISNLRRAPEKDELEIVRPHVAKNEAVVWRAHVSPTLAPGAAPSAETAEPLAVAPRPVAAAERAARPLHWWAIGAAIALAYGLLVWFKWRSFARACRENDAHARALVPFPIGLRAPLAGLFAAAAAALALPLSAPTAAACSLSLSLLLASLRAPALKAVLRGPGQWLPLQESEAFRRVTPRLPGRLLDCSTLPGFVCFVLGLATAVGAAAWLLRRSPYEALLALLAATVLLPIFSTGRSVDLPPHPLAHGPMLARLSRKLRRPTTKVVPWARVRDVDGQPDELRLLVQPKPCPPGLVALEVGIESVRGLGGAVSAPYVLIRVKEGAALLSSMPRSAVWTRGRKPDERVALLRPTLPTLGSCLTLLDGLLKRIDQANSRKSSSGSSERTSKLGRVPSPAHAM